MKRNMDGGREGRKGTEARTNDEEGSERKQMQGLKVRVEKRI